MNGKCAWVLTPNSPGVTAVYCNQPTGWIMKRDDDDNLVRKYHHFCKKHLEQAKKQEEGNDDDLC